MKSIKEFYNMLVEPYKTNAINSATAEGVNLEEMVDGLELAIMKFTWDTSKKNGYDKQPDEWMDIYRNPYHYIEIYNKDKEPMYEAY